MLKQHTQIEWNDELEENLRRLVQAAAREDLQSGQDWTTVSLVPPTATAKAAAVSRERGVIAVIQAGAVVLDEMDCDAEWDAKVTDGTLVEPGTTIAEISGNARDLLTAERTILNMLGQLSGIATLAHRFVEASGRTDIQICETRKTTAGWRHLEKYAVRCGGGHNHRTGLYDAILIKDNHLAFFREEFDTGTSTPSAAVTRAREFLASLPDSAADKDMIIEIEVDSLEQLVEVLSTKPDIVLLDNMPPEMLRQAIAIRDEAKVPTLLEASGGVNLETVSAIAATGVERVSVGALTHSARCLDIGLDWH